MSLSTKVLTRGKHSKIMRCNVGSGVSHPGRYSDTMKRPPVDKTATTTPIYTDLYAAILALCGCPAPMRNPTRHSAASANPAVLKTDQS